MADVVSVYRLTMDIKKPTTHIVTPVIVQYDNVRLEVTVLDDGKPFDLTNVSDVEFTHKRPDLEVIVAPGVVEDGKIVYRYLGNEMDVPGNIKASFSMVNGDEKVSVRDFYVVVQQSLKESQYIPGAPKVDRLQQLIVEVETLSASAGTVIGEATTQSAYAKEQGDYAKEQGDYVVSQSSKLEDLEVQYAPRLNLAEEELKENTSSVIKNILDGSGVKWIAHRGAITISPGNTVPAFENAGKLGYWGCESDVQVTQDGVWVAIHDVTVDASTNGTGNVSGMTYAQLMALDIDAGNSIAMYPGLKIPTFEEYLIICKKYSMVACVEMKSTAVTSENVASFVGLIEKHNMIDKVLVSSFDVANLQAIRSVSRLVALEYLCNVLTEDEINVAASIPDCGINPGHASLTKTLVESAHSKGIHVNCYTIFNPATATTAINNGVDALITESLRGVIQ